MTKEDISTYFKNLQDSICKELELVDGGAKFIEDVWERREGGGGRTKVIQQGNVIEKGGVAFSAVHGPMPEFLKSELTHSGATAQTFFATGVSIVIHPVSPMVPIIHMNVRYFETSNNIKWFGGGIDLTPHYVDESDAQFFHQQLKAVCDKHNSTYYNRFKTWADDYFFIKHRNETRGIGGIFFDQLKPDENHTTDRLFSFVKDVGELFAPIYIRFMNKNKSKPFGENEKQWQLLRRGRYVEFNLAYDRGTKFGLETNGRVESILMSLPQTASWLYNFSPRKGSKEEQTLSFLKKQINWVR